ncbi:SusD/RagB family nutrient-binding outer membrane lipoprotein [Labilibaculum euxinus]|uniref:SusD/RagB family nutrient-binding outer membrane lipoprotein n=1 Tax=Labilibaculum euxinus TaxID=2686357 RepID=A0A7M4D7Z1_9BACT|nr:SusD/RagB family nutrient-binding outer membrane lipoprotein [Labilibaculum euxinus]MUP38770.1 SusD/RagB family nutrient-binding outer membrane lipoprotein [Labilibaculum euxinus]MVB07975.1 SusD/RagB family nutrient-binding outer membrane lipoprotein [Labilibaculum euxinus]
MKKLKYILIGVLLMGVGFTSCDLEDNNDPKKATEVPAATLFTSGMISFVDQYNNMSVNYNISRLLAQYWMETTYTDESRYDFQDRGIPDSFWDELYRDCLMDFQEAKMVIDAGEFEGALLLKANNQKAIIEIQMVYVYAVLAETFGDIPYSEALQGGENTLPKYDDAATVYADLFVRLDAALATLDSSNGSWGAEDLLFEGDVDSWKTFGNALKLRMGMRMADVPSFNSKSVVEAAVAAGVYNDDLEGAFFSYIGTDPYVNTIYDGFEIDGRKDYVPSNTLIDIMNTLNDPRRALWFTQKDGAYVGLTYGKTDGGTYDNFSHFTPMFFDPKLEVALVDYVEMEFYLAEAVERGYAVGGTAAEHYNNGITASILYYGGTAADAATYLAQPEVAYSTATGTWKQKIGTQKWIAMYNRGVEGWTEWRRLDFPVLNVPEELTYGDIPVRYPYPYNENDQNLDNYTEASTAIGGDKATTKLWFDVN